MPQIPGFLDFPRNPAVARNAFNARLAGARCVEEEVT